MSILLNLLCLGLGALQTPPAIDTGFRPSKDLPVLTNSAGRGTAIIGQCNGIDEMAITYFQWRKAYPKAQGLAAQTQMMRELRSDRYLKGVLDMAMQQSYAGSKPQLKFGYAGGEPKKFEQELADTLKTGGRPRSVVFGSASGGIAHRMTVYGADQVVGPDGPRWVFRIADSNTVGRPGINPDDVRLVYVPAQGGQPARWSEQEGGRELARYDTGDMVRSPIVKPSVYVELVTQGLQGKPLGEIRNALSIPEIPPPTPGLGPGSIEVVKDPKAGGVVVRFDPTMFNGSVSEDELAALEERYAAFLGDGNSRAAVFRLEPRRFELKLIPVESLLDGPDLGLTRLRGFVRDAQGHVLLAGESEPGEAPIARDVLVVALKAIYLGSEGPFVSLDANPAAMDGPQRVRVGGLPAGLLSSQYVLDMLDADYLMKQINLGARVPRDPEFRSWLQLLAAEAGGFESFHRMWFSPLVTPVGDLFELRDADALAVLFDGRVQVQSEQMRAQTGALVPGGAPDASVEEAAGLMTRRFEALCEEYPEFARLRALFDASQLAAALKAYGVRSPRLDALAGLDPAHVTVPSEYSGIGPVSIEGTRFVVSGGVQAPHRYVSRTAVSTQALAPMLADSDTAVVELPNVITVDSAASLGVEIETRLARAREAFAAGSYDEAAERSGEALRLEPANPDALVLRATSLAMLDRNAEALKEFEALGDANPELRAMAAMLHARLGDAEGVKREASLALAAAPNSEGVLAAVAGARLLVLDLPGAAGAIERLRAIAPASVRLAALQALLLDLRARTPQDAQKHLSLLRSMPPAIAAAFSAAMANVASTDRVIPQLEDALLLLDNGWTTVPSELAIPYRLRLALLMGYAQRSALAGPGRHAARDRGHALYARLVQDQPKSGLPHLMRAYLAAWSHETDADVLRWLKLAAANSMASDPVFPAIQRGLGKEDLINGLAMEMWVKHATPANPGHGLLDFLASRRAGQPEALLLKALRTPEGAALISDLRNGVNELDAAGKKRSLARFKGMEPKIPRAMTSRDVTLGVAGRIYATIGVLQLQLNQPQGAQQNLGTGVRLLRTAEVGPTSRQSNASLIALMWLMNSGFAMEGLGKSTAISGEMVALEKDLEALLTAKVPLVRARPRLAAMEKRLDGALAAMRAHIAGSLAATEKSMGGLSRAAEEMVFALLQDAMSDGKTPFDAVPARYPALAKTPEFQSLAAKASRVGPTILVQGNVESRWKALMAKCTGETDFLACASLATLGADFLKLMDPGLRNLLDRYAAEARLRAAGF